MNAVYRQWLAALAQGPLVSLLDREYVRDEGGRFAETGEARSAEIVATFAARRAKHGDALIVAVDYDETKFILPNGTRLAHGYPTHAEAAEAMGVHLDDALLAGVVRYTKLPDGGTAAEIGAPITRAQAQHLFDGNTGEKYLAIDVMGMGVREYEVFTNERTPGKRLATPASIRNWVNQQFKTDERFKAQTHLSYAREWLEDPVPQQYWLGDTEGHPFRGNQWTSGEGGGIDPANKATWYRDGGGWNRSVEGEQPYGWAEVSPTYEPPEVQHTVLRMKDIGLWGGSHHGSQVITGDAAAQMGLAGYQDLEASTGASKIATRMLEEIAADTQGSEEPLYHSFENVKQTVFRPGDTLRLPPLAAAGKPHPTYATRSEVESQHGMPIIFAFPKGTPMVGYSTATRADARDLGLATVQDVHKEFGHVWDEAIVAGGFEVERVETVYLGSQHRNRPIPETEPIPQLYGQVVHLKPIEVYDPTTKTWRPRG